MQSSLILLLQRALITSTLLVGVHGQIYGQGSSTIKTTPTTPISPLNTNKPASKATESEPTAPKTPPVKEGPPATQSIYLYPGILVFQNNRWEGGDFLSNLGSQIGVFVEVIKPENAKIGIEDSEIKQRIVAAFAKVAITPNPPAQPGKPPLPDFQMEILIYPIDKGFAAACTGRLYESVKLDRFEFPENTFFQAITWEKKNLIVAPSRGFREHLLKTIDEIVQAFVERYQSQQQAQ